MTDRLDTILTEFLLFLPSLISALVFFIATLIIAGLLAKAVGRALQQRMRRYDTVRLLQQLVRWSVLVIGTLAALDQVNFDVGSFVAGIGVLGFTVGFALQDIARNFVAGILLLLRQPFHIGDAVTIAGFSGKVLDVNTRDTVLRTFEGTEVVLPNIDVFTGPIVCLTTQPPRRRSVEIGLGYGQDVGRAFQVFLDTVAGIEGVVAEPEPALYAQSLGDSVMNLTLFFWVDQSEFNLLQVHSNVVIALERAANEHGIDLPYPIQEVRVTGLPDAAG